MGEQLASDLNFLEQQGLTKIINLRAVGALANVMDQIVDGFDEMVQQGRYRYPNTPESSYMLDLNDDEPNRELRLQYARLPFRILKLGYLTASRGGAKYMFSPGTSSFQDFRYDNLVSLLSKKAFSHPTDNSYAGILSICMSGNLFGLQIDLTIQCLGPKNGSQLVGPIDDSGAMHHCYTDFILAGLAKSKYLIDYEAHYSSRTEAEAAWKEELHYTCRDTCPGRSCNTNIPRIFTNISQGAQAATSNTSIAFPSVTRRSLRLATPASGSTTLSPLLEITGITGSLPVYPSSPTFSTVSLAPPSRSLLLNNRPLTESHRHRLPQPPPPVLSVPYTPTHAPVYESFIEFETHMESTVHSSAWLEFSLLAQTVTEAAEGLVSAIIATKRDMHAPLYPTTANVTIQPDGAVLSSVFSAYHWMFRAYVFFLSCFSVNDLSCFLVVALAKMPSVVVLSGKFSMKPSKLLHLMTLSKVWTTKMAMSHSRFPRMTLWAKKVSTNVLR